MEPHSIRRSYCSERQTNGNARRMQRTLLLRRANSCFGIGQGKVRRGEDRSFDSFGHMCRAWRASLAAKTRSPVCSTWAISAGHASAGSLGRLWRSTCAATIRTSSQMDEPKRRCTARGSATSPETPKRLNTGESWLIKARSADAS